MAEQIARFEELNRQSETDSAAHRKEPDGDG